MGNAVQQQRKQSEGNVMRIGIVVDSGCDLPADFIQEHNIQILPASIRVGSDLFTDERNAEATLAFYESHIGDKSHDAETFPFSVEQIQQVFLERLVLDFDHVFCIPVWKARSKTYENATRASFAILSRYHKVRNDAGVHGHFSMRVMDSKTVFTGLAVQAAEAVRLVNDGLQYNDIRARLGEIADHTIAYLVPADLAYIRQRTKQRGEKSIGLATYLIGSALDIKPILNIYREETRPVAKVRGYTAAVEKMLAHVAAVVRDGQLLSRQVCLSYGGNPAAVRGMPGFAELERICRERGIELLVSIMSAVAAVNVGAGAITVAYAGEYREMH